MIKTKDQLLEAIKERIGDDVSDEALAFIEDATDTLNDMSVRANGDGTDWKKKYEDNDAEWRQKYRDRFFHGAAADEDTEDDDKPKTYRYDDLFKEE